MGLMGYTGLTIFADPEIRQVFAEARETATFQQVQEC